MKIKAAVMAFLIIGMIAATIGVVSAGIPPSPERIPPEARLPDVYDLAPEQAEDGLSIADDHAPNIVPPS